MAIAGEEEKEQTILDQFLDFFGAVLYGNDPDENDTVSEEIKNIITSDTMMSALVSKVNDRMKQYSQTISDSIVATQNITIDCGTDKLTDWHLRPMVKEYTWYGEEIPGSGCIKYGCCYDISQSSQIRLSSINKTTIEDHQELFTDISQEMKHQVSVTAGPKNEGLKVLNASINQVKDSSLSKIKEILDNASETNFETGQDIIIKSIEPLRCVNKCNEPPSAGTVEQSLNIEIVTNNIITSVVKSIMETYLTMTSKVESEIVAIDITKIYTFAFLSCILIVLIYTICFFLILLIPQLKEVIKKSPIHHFLTCIACFVVYLLWGIIVCIIKGRGFLCFF